MRNPAFPIFFMVEDITKKLDAIEEKVIFRSKLFKTSLHSAMILYIN